MKKRIKKHILASRPYHNTVKYLHRIKFKRYEGLTLYEVIKIFIRKITNDEIIERAEAVAFNFTLSVFPGIILLFTLIPYIHELVPDISQERVIEFIGDLLPEKLFEDARYTIEDIVKNTRGGLLTFVAFLSLILATNGTMSLIHAFNACYKTIEKRSYLATRLIATALTLALAFALILAFLLLVVGNLVIGLIESIEWLGITEYTFYMLLALRFLVVFIVFYLAISLLYYFGPSVHYNWRFFSFGSIIATLLCLAVSYGFSFYVSNFGTYNRLYGSIGMLIALMVWQFLISIVLLVGYEINASIHQAYRFSGVAREAK